jgi:large subunit ribosomal protein L15
METLKPPKGSTHQRKRLGRGNGSGNGTTAGKGTKGQNARSGGGVRPGFEGGQMPLYRRVARRGFSNHRFKRDFVTVSLQSINDRYKSGQKVNLETLREHRLIGKRDSLVKVLADGEIKKKLTFEGVAVSRSAAAKIIAAGGSVDNVAGPPTVSDDAASSAPAVEETVGEKKSTPPAKTPTKARAAAKKSDAGEEDKAPAATEEPKPEDPPESDSAKKDGE